MARGQELKKEITKKILEFFPNSFLYNDGKEIRICGQENGEEIQVKVTLTAAKENVYSGQDNVTPGADIAEKGELTSSINNEETKILTNMFFPSDEEKDNVKKLMQTFGL